MTMAAGFDRRTFVIGAGAAAGAAAISATFPAGAVQAALPAGASVYSPLPRAVRVADRILVAGTAPIWPDGSVDPDPGAQARRCIEIMLTALAEAGGTARDVVRTRSFLTDAAHAEAVGIAHGEAFSEVRPASTMVVVAGLLDPRWVVEMELEAVLGV